MVSLARKEIWFRGMFHLIAILGQSPFVRKLRKAESAQHSVLHEHQDGMHWSLGASQCAFFGLFRGIGSFPFSNLILPANR